MTNQVVGPDGTTSENAQLGPDGQAIPERLGAWPWTQAERERGAIRKVPGGQSYETAWAIVGPDGEEIGSVLVPAFDVLIEEIRKLRFALTVKGVAEDLGDLSF